MNSIVEIATQLSFGRPDSFSSAAKELGTADAEQRGAFFNVTEMHHVVLRAFSPLREEAIRLGDHSLEEWCRSVIATEQARIENALMFLQQICTALEKGGAPITVMKSLDHWPDIGNDLDLYTTATLPGPRDAHGVTN